MTFRSIKPPVLKPLGTVAAVAVLVLGAAPGARAASGGEPAQFAAQANWPSGTYASPAFTPDGETLFVTYSVETPAGRRSTIMMSHRVGAGWSTPQTAPFSGRWRDLETTMAPDGSYLVFASNRPAAESGQPLDAFYAGAARPGRGGNLWRVDRLGRGWSAPARLPDVINSNTSVFAPAISGNGDLIFMQPDPATSKFRLYRSHRSGGAYGPPAPLSFSDGLISDYDPAIAPDGSFIVFSSSRSPTPKDAGEPALFIAAADGEGWRQPVALAPMALGTEARLSPNLLTLYFATTRPTPAAPAPQAGADQKIWTVRLPVAKHSRGSAPGSS